MGSDPKTIKVRICVAIDLDEEVALSFGMSEYDCDIDEMKNTAAGYLVNDGYTVSKFAWVTAEIPIQEEIEVEGVVDGE